MNIEVNIKAPGLTEALNNIAIALSAIANISGGAAPAPAPVAETPASPLKDEGGEQTELKPADLKKQKIAEEIIALGGTPPEKGSVAKFEAALLEAKKAKIESGGGELCVACEGSGKSSAGEVCRICKGSGVKPEAAAEDTKTDEPGETTEEAEEQTGAESEAGEEYSLNDVRTLAHAVVKSTPEDPALGKTKLGASLKKVGAANLTNATQEQLNQIVPLLEQNLGKTLAEVVAEAGE